MTRNPVTLSQWATAVKRLSAETMDRLIERVWLPRLYGTIPETKHTQFAAKGWMN